MQFVWVYWHGGAQKDELRWSMRSVLKNYQGDAKLMLVGDKPDWYAGPYIPVSRLPRGANRAFRDSLNKLITAVAHDDVDDEFVWMMDDIYMAHAVEESQMRTWYYQSDPTRHMINQWQPSNKWLRLKKRTYQVLLAHDLPTRDFATHLPQFIQRAKFKAMMMQFGREVVDQPMLWEILYGNLFCAADSQPSQPHLYRSVKHTNYDSYKRQDRPFINNGNHAWNEALRGFLWESFIQRTPFERSDAPLPRPWYRTSPPQQ